ncbi:MAG: tetratricopeptide repeat protein [Verrucomicrobia bacterium]|nr:tetratricopeptide repeat protein [Verrucomicrobiota bacterium]
MRQQGLLVPALVAVGLMLASMPAWPEDVVVTRSQAFRGRVVSVDAAGIRIQLTQGGEVTVPRAGVVRLTVEPPPSVVRGIAAYEKGDLRNAQLNLGKVMMQYLGLDTEWAAKGMVYFGRASLLAGDYDNAGKAFKVFLQTYPEHPLSMAASVGLTEIELARKNYAPALTQFQELAQPYDKQLKPVKDQLPYAAEIYLGIGQCQEGLARPADALDGYLRVIGLYPVEPFYSEALYRGAGLLAASNQTAKAEGMLTELIENYPASLFATKAIEMRKALGARRADQEAAAKPPKP